MGQWERRRDVLAFFKGSLKFGSDRRQLIPLQTLSDRQQQTVVQHTTEATTTTASLQSQTAQPSQTWQLPVVIAFTDTPTKDQHAHNAPEYDYREYLLRSRFCIIVSGHSHTSKRLYDAIAAGCVPLFVRNDPSQMVFRNRLDWSRFSVYFPLWIIESDPTAFLRCMRAVPASAVRAWQRRLLAARDSLVYAWKRRGNGSEHGAGIPTQANATDFVLGSVAEMIVAQVADGCHILAPGQGLQPARPECRAKLLPPVWEALPEIAPWCPCSAERGRAQESAKKSCHAGNPGKQAPGGG